MRALFAVLILLVAAKTHAAVSLSQYRQAFERLGELYPNIQIVARWEVDEPQAFASPGRLVVSGGFARKNNINYGGLLTVACHEIGHAAFRLNEGEADYFASFSCLPRFFETSDNFRWLETIERVPRALRSECLNQSAHDFAKCIRMGLAVFNASEADRKRCVGWLDDLERLLSETQRRSVRVPERFFRCLRSDVEVDRTRMLTDRALNHTRRARVIINSSVHFRASDLRVVNRSYSAHNSPQCRMDTLMAGVKKADRPRCFHRPR